MINLSRLEKLMGKKNWGAGELAEYSGVKYDTVYSLRVGRRTNTTSRTLKKIADALGTSVDYLLGETDEEKPALQKLPEQVRQLAEIARNLSEMRQEELTKIAALLEKLDRERQAESETNEVYNLLESIERTINREIRLDFEKLILSKGVSIDPAS